MPLEPVGDVFEQWARETLAPDEFALFEAARASQLARNAYWEAHRPQPVMHGTPFRPRDHSEASAPPEAPPYGPPSTWAHDGTETWDLDERGQRVPHGIGYCCPICRDARFVRQELPVGADGFGRAVPCRCVTEDARTRLAHLAARVRRMGLPEGLLGCTFDDFARRKGTSEAWGAVHAVLDALRTGGETPRWVALYGAAGTGKSHLLAAATQVAALLTEVRWASLPELLEVCKADGFALDAELTRQASSVPVLVLDEVGSHGAGDWAREKCELVLNRRYAERAILFLGMAVQPAEVKAWSPRIADRLADRRIAVTAALTCTSYRRERGA